jgi:hypothetical protein
MKRIRIYDNQNPINTWSNGQVELGYKDLDPETGELIQTGSEDFSAERRTRYIKTVLVENVYRNYSFTISTDRNTISELYKMVNK